MTKISLFERRPKTILALIITVGLLLTVALTETLLYFFYPMVISTAGFVQTENGGKYGWGYDPNQLVRTEDPDTGEKYLDRVNSHGWRDRARTFDNPNNAFRIAVIGDSNTFGFIVPAESIYTRVLEDMLRSEGFNAEVLNISYPGWGTHQVYEALQRDAARYSPDLVVYAYSGNDMGESINYKTPGKTGRRVPFYYALDDANQLIRHDVPDFQREFTATTRKHIISKSQILSRLWLIRGSMRANAQPRHVMNSRKFYQVHQCAAPSASENFVADLAKYVDQAITAEDVRALSQKHGLDSETEKKVLQITENRHFNGGVSVQNYLFGGGYRDFERLGLLFAFVSAANDFSKSIGAKFAVLSNMDAGRLEWERYWCMADDTELRRNEPMRANRDLEAYARRINYGYVKNVRKIVRARNDPHPNIEGNRAIAENLFLYLMENHQDDLKAH